MSGGLQLLRHVPREGSDPWERPAPTHRAVRSEAIERRIRTAASHISDAGIRRLFEGTLPNTLDTTIIAGGTDDQPDTFVLTGDIHAMWLRELADTNQDTTASFNAGGAAFTTKGVKMDRNAYNLGTSLNLSNKAATQTLSISYDAEIKDQYLSHSGRVQARFDF